MSKIQIFSSNFLDSKPKLYKKSHSFYTGGYRKAIPYEIYLKFKYEQENEFQKKENDNKQFFKRLRQNKYFIKKVKEYNINKKRSRNF